MITVYVKLIFQNFVIELANEIKENQEYLNSLIRDMLALGNQFQDSWNIINSVLGVKKSQMCINGGKLIKSFPIDYIDRYQNMHSVSSTMIIKLVINTFNSSSFFLGNQTRTPEKEWALRLSTVVESGTFFYYNSQRNLESIKFSTLGRYVTSIHRWN